MWLEFGHVLYRSVWEESYYGCNQARFSCLQLSKESIEAELQDLGFTIQELNIYPSPEPENNDVSDYKAVFHLVALKSDKIWPATELSMLTPQCSMAMEDSALCEILMCVQIFKKEQKVSKMHVHAWHNIYISQQPTRSNSSKSNSENTYSALNLCKTK